MPSTPRAAVLAALTAASLGACAPTSTAAWALPDWPDAQALLLHLRAGPRDELVAFDRAAAPDPLPFARLDDAEGVEVTALALPEPLAAYAIAPGPQALVPRARGRAWPPTVALARRRSDDDDSDDDDWRARARVEETTLADLALDANPLCPTATAQSWPLTIENPADLVALDRRTALVATDVALWSLQSPGGTPTPQPLPGGAPLRALWADGAGALVAGTAGTAELYLGRWDGAEVSWGSRGTLAPRTALVEINGVAGGSTYGVTSTGEVIRARADPASSERLYAFRAGGMTSGAGLALRGAENLVAYSNVQPGVVAFIEGGRARAEAVFPGPLNLLTAVEGLGVVAGNALGFSLLDPSASTFTSLGPAPLEPQALVGTRDGFVAFGTNGRIVRYDRRSRHTCPPQPITAGEFKVAVALDDETAIAVEQPGRPGEPMTAWHVRLPALPF